MMKFIRNLLLEESSHKVLAVAIPHQLAAALETLIFIRNAYAKTDMEKIDADYVIGIALAEYLHTHLSDVASDKINRIDKHDYLREPRYTNGRKQSRDVDLHKEATQPRVKHYYG